MIETAAGLGRAEYLRQAMVDDLVATGSIASDAVQAAFRVVPRHLFAPEVPPEEAYANDVVRTKHDEHGMTISSISAPWLQAAMLEQAGIETGMRCLEVGSGGYNAALMAELAGPTGEVTTVDIDPDVIARARRYLPVTGYERVDVVLADAEHGVPDRAPYDRILVTVGVWDIPPTWVDQLIDGGRLVVPLRLRGLSRSVCFRRCGDHLESLSHQMAGFVNVQGAGARPERLVLLHDEDVGLRIDDYQQVDAERLGAALVAPRAAEWSGVRFGGMEPFDDLFLWLASTLDSFCLLTRTRSESARELVDPASSMGTPTALADGSLAYLAFRQVESDTYEFGAYAHGDDAAALAEALCEQVRRWDRDHRAKRPARIAVYPAATPRGQLPPGRVLEKRHTKVVISWP